MRIFHGDFVCFIRKKERDVSSVVIVINPTFALGISHLKKKKSGSICN